MTKELNDHNLDQRELDQAAEIMEHLEMVDIGHNAKLPFKERVAALALIHTIRRDYRKEDHEPDNAGSAVRKYTKSFAHAGRRQRGDTGRTDDETDAAIDADASAGAESATQQ